MKWYTKTAIALGSILLVTGSFFVYHMYDTTSNATEEMHEPLESRTLSDGVSKERADSPSPGDPLSFLVAGVDSHSEAHYGRADALLLLTVNAQEKSIQMVSIPRDTRTEIVGQGTIEKINHAYAYGGPDMLIQSVENLFDLPIDHYLSIDMEQFIPFIDTLGGVNVTNELAFSLSGHEFDEGELSLDGEEALAYVRMRKDDPNGDAGRTERQRDVVESIIDEGLQLSQVSSAPELIRSIGSTVETDLTLSQMISYAQNYHQATESIEQLELTFHEETIDGIWYAVIPEDEQQRVATKLQSHLNLIKE
ncbi:LCP family protein required for cell wall assembly [Alkalihalobacillus xiaoxiensis]|uniref:LCP family protein required for cell wall assembly n=1 Tax=Shouchella xiaoxiensis TaxID=766895 RepID=A0ABS2SVH1_9BACI|nr:LCP family protein [Shouchella xiaoxiensis]MBM7839530.1 LCP family protein required for cell wall assembly [Shouchella xiaoxiensis]